VAVIPDRHEGRLCMSAPSRRSAACRAAGAGQHQGGGDQGLPVRPQINRGHKPTIFGRRSASLGLKDYYVSLAYLSEPGCCAVFKECWTLLPCVVASGGERLPRLGLVAAAERQQTFSTQAMDFGQIKAEPRFVDHRDRTVEMREAICWTASGQQMAAKPR
jgi:hypothetical protein